MPDIDYDALLSDLRINAGRVPIAAGEDLRGTAEFEAIETEFRKIETAGPSAVDWKMLNRTTIDLLRNRSKDLVLASRLAYGLHREEGYHGLAVAMTIVHDMVEQHWDSMFPPVNRERGRAGAFDWFAEKISPLVESGAPADDKKIFALVAHDRLVNLDTLLGEKLTKFPAALGPLIRALRPHSREARQALEAAAAPPPAAAAPVEQPAASPVAEAPMPRPPEPAARPQPAAATAPIADLVLDDDAQKSFDVVCGAALRLASSLRQQTPSDVRAYRLSRFAIWSGLQAAPPDKAGKTSLPPPQKARLTEIQALRSAGNQAGLLLAVESTFATSPFWLDAQSILFEAMSALGSDYDQARMAITSETATLLARLPDLPSLSFSDGTPFADSSTVTWIANHVRNGAGGGGEGGEENAMAAASRLAQSGQVVAGLKLLMQHADSRRGERERFVARLDLGEFCLRYELLQPLLALVDGLAETAEQRALEIWEPQLAARLANLTWRAVTHKNARRLIEERDLVVRKTRILGQLAKLDIVSAVEFSQP